LNLYIFIFEPTTILKVCFAFTRRAPYAADEPTSGLDATTALLVVNKLRAIANGERGGHRAAVVTSIHQPRNTIMPLFDCAILLADGREVYAGPTYQPLAGGALSQDGVMGWLTDVGHPCPMFESPPDYLLDLINTRVEEESGGDGGDGDDDGGDAPYAFAAPAAADDAEAASGGGGNKLRDRDVVVKELAAAWTTSERRAAYVRRGEEADARSKKEAESAAGGSGISAEKYRRARHPLAVWCTQFGALFSRTFLYKLREPSVVASQFLNSVLIPLIVGSIYFRMSTTVSSSGDRISAISLIVLLQSLMCFDQLLLFPKERGLFLHESNGGMYKTSVFYWARTLSEAWSIILFALICAVICYEMYGLHDSVEGRVAFYLVVTAVTMAGASFLTALGSLCKTFEQSNAMAGTLLIVLMLFDGNWINRRNIPVYYRWLADVSFLGYAVEAAVVSDFKRQDFTCTERAVEEEGCTPLTGKQIIRSLEFDEDATWPKFWLLILVTVLYRLVAFLGLHFCWTGQTFKERWTKLWA
jgi:ATP-binding cassette subfamily G (WHITE) protein 2